MILQYSTKGPLELSSVITEKVFNLSFMQKEEQQFFLSYLPKLNEAGVIIMVCIFKEKTQDLR